LLAAQAATLNYSCSPNATRHGVEVFAWHAISAGKEMTIDERLNAFEGNSWPCSHGSELCSSWSWAVSSPRSRTAVGD
jgi:hypothetical protein